MEFYWIEGPAGREACRFVRKKVFVEEQGFSEELEFDAVDESAWHLSAQENGAPAAAARLFAEGGEWHAGRICVLPEYRGTGLGARLLAELENKARSLGADALSLGAQCRAAGFYEKSGYRSVGGEYLDEFCPHVKMEKKLGP